MRFDRTTRTMITNILWSPITYCIAHNFGRQYFKYSAMLFIHAKLIPQNGHKIQLNHIATYLPPHQLSEPSLTVYKTVSSVVVTQPKSVAAACNIIRAVPQPQTATCKIRARLHHIFEYAVCQTIRHTIFVRGMTEPLEVIWSEAEFGSIFGVLS